MHHYFRPLRAASAARDAFAQIGTIFYGVWYGMVFWCVVRYCMIGTILYGC